MDASRHAHRSRLIEPSEQYCHAFIEITVYQHTQHASIFSEMLVLGLELARKRDSVRPEEITRAQSPNREHMDDASATSYFSWVTGQRVNETAIRCRHPQGIGESQGTLSIRDQR